MNKVAVDAGWVPPGVSSRRPGHVQPVVRALARAIALLLWVSASPTASAQGGTPVTVIVLEERPGLSVLPTGPRIDGASVELVADAPREPFYVDRKTTSSGGVANFVLPLGFDVVESITATHPEYVQKRYDIEVDQLSLNVVFYVYMERRALGSVGLWERSSATPDVDILRTVGAVLPPDELRALVEEDALDPASTSSRAGFYLALQDTYFDPSAPRPIQRSTSINVQEAIRDAYGPTIGDLEAYDEFSARQRPAAFSEEEVRSGASSGSSPDSFSLYTAAKLINPSRLVFLETTFDRGGELIASDVLPLDPGFQGFFTNPATMSREDTIGAIFYDYERQLFVELDLDNRRAHPDLRLQGPGTVLGTLFGGLESRAAPQPVVSGSASEPGGAAIASESATASGAGGGTLVFTTRSQTRVELFDPTCRSGESRLYVTEFDAAGQQVADDLVGGPISTQVGQGCYPPHTQDTADAELGDSWGVAYQVGKEIRWTTRSLASGASPQTFVLGSQPAALDGIYFWRPAIVGDRDSGGYVIDVPNGDAYEGSEDGARLGIPPWRLVNSVLDDLTLVSTGEQLNHAIGSDLSGLGWLVGTFRRADLPSTASIRSSGAVGAGGDEVVAEVAIPGCLDTATRFCANHNRFGITVRYETAQGAAGEAQARPLSNDSGTFWFFDRDNRELIVKLLDACGVNGHYWFFAAGLTDVGVQLEVWDRLTGEAVYYENAVGRPFQPILDTSAFECGAGEAARRMESAVRAASSARSTPTSTIASPRLSARGSGSGCGGAPEDLCLNGGRFRVEVDYTDFSGATSSAFGDNLTDDTGALFFFDQSNVEMLIKVLDACSLGGYWVFAAGLTNVGVEIRVTDTLTGQSAEYRTPVGDPFAPIADTSTFGCS